MKKIMICLLFSTIVLLTACSLGNSQDTNKKVDNKLNEATMEDGDKTNVEKDTTENNEQESQVNEATENPNNNSEEINKDTDIVEQDISAKVKDYIINGQGNKSEAEKLKWSTAFLNQVDIGSLYNQYISNGGNSEDIEKFAEYITLNAPIPNNWEELFKKDLYDIYGQEVVKIEFLEGDLYQAYVNIDGSEVLYCTVSARTGYFHG